MLLEAHMAVHERAGAVGVWGVLELSLMGLGVAFLTVLFVLWAVACTLGAGHGAVAVVGRGGHGSQSQLWLQQHGRHKQLGVGRSDIVNDGVTQ